MANIYCKDIEFCITLECDLIQNLINQYNGCSWKIIYKFCILCLLKFPPQRHFFSKKSSKKSELPHRNCNIVNELNT